MTIDKLIINNSTRKCRFKIKHRKELQFDSKAVKVKELEERKEMIVLWRRGDGILPKQQ